MKNPAETKIKLRSPGAADSRRMAPSKTVNARRVSRSPRLNHPRRRSLRKDFGVLQRLLGRGRSLRAGRRRIAGSLYLGGGRLQSRRVVLVLDQIRHVVGEVRAFRSGASDGGPRHQLHQRLVQLHAVVGEIHVALARSGEDGRARGRIERFSQMPIGRVASLHQIRCGGMNVVEQVKDKSLSDGRGW